MYGVSDFGRRLMLRPAKTICIDYIMRPDNLFARVGPPTAALIDPAPLDTG
jgi:hypothetical protein